MNNLNKNFKFDFIVVGTPKSGTTYTYQLLKEHPEVVVTSSKDGIKGGYFSNKTTESIRKYIEKISTKGKVIGEFREGYYLNGINIPKSIYENNNKTKIIICLRNPYERAYSAYKHILLLKSDKTDFTKNEKDYGYILEKGFYYKYLSPFFNIFPRENILILWFSDLKDNPQQHRENLYSFLNVSKDIIPSTEGRQLNDTRFKASAIGRIFHKKIMPFFDYIGFGRILRSSKNTRSVFYKIASFVGGKTRIDESKILSKKEFLTQIGPIYDEDIKNLGKLLGKNLSYWLYKI